MPRIPAGAPLFGLATATVVGGRRGRGETQDGALAVAFALPGTGTAGAGRSVPGSASHGVTPEHLLAAAYAASLGSAVEAIGRMRRLDVAQARVSATVALIRGEEGFDLAVTLRLTAPALALDEAREVLEAAHRICPYGRALRGNVAVELEVEP